MNKVFVMIGLSKENFEESECSDKKNNKPPSNQPEVNLLSRPQISNSSTINYDQPYESPMRKSDFDQGQEFGIPSYSGLPEPVAAISFASFS